MPNNINENTFFVARAGEFRGPNAEFVPDAVDRVITNEHVTGEVPTPTGPDLAELTTGSGVVDVAGEAPVSTDEVFGAESLIDGISADGAPEAGTAVIASEAPPDPQRLAEIRQQVQEAIGRNASPPGVA